MGRAAKPSYRESDGWWYATIVPGAKPEKLQQGGKRSDAKKVFK